MKTKQETAVKRLRGRPVGRNPDAAITVTIRLRPSDMAVLAAGHPDGWRARVADLLAPALRRRK